MPNFNKEALDHICKTILDSDQALTSDLIDKIEKLYEEALITKFIKDRDEATRALNDRVAKRLSEETDSRPTPQPEKMQELEELQKPANLGDEVKVLPHPEGPPKPQPRVQPEPPTPKQEQAAPAEAPNEESKAPEPQQPVQNEPPQEVKDALSSQPMSEPARSNPRLQKLNIGLNDRIAFVKQLFMGSQEDYQRVVGQINTMDDYDETIEFILNVVKPDYDWSQVEETEQRLLDLVAHRFNKS